MLVCCGRGTLPKTTVVGTFRLQKLFTQPVTSRYTDVIPSALGKLQPRLREKFPVMDAMRPGAILWSDIVTLSAPRPHRKLSRNRLRMPTMSPSATSSRIHKRSVSCDATPETVKAIWRSCNAVCFDVDSTITPIEGIDEIAAFCGVGKEVSEWTKQAMGGNLPFKTCLRERLNIIRPTRTQTETFMKTHPPLLTDGILELVKALRARGKEVYLVSGGFDFFILPLAALLDIPEENVFCNRLMWYYNGEYAGFDESAMTCDNGGKGRACAYLKKAHGHNLLVMIGDGSTDLEAAPPADAFIGFGGVVVRERVRREAKWFVNSFQELREELPALDRNGV